MSVNAMKEEFDVVELFGRYALFTNARIDRGTVPSGWHCYDIRGSDEDPGELAALEPKVSANHAGTILSPRPIPFPDGQDHLDIREEIGFAECCDITLTEFCDIYGIDAQAQVTDQTSQDNQKNQTQEAIHLRITNFEHKTVTLVPRLGVYSAVDFMGQEMPGLAVDLDIYAGPFSPPMPYTRLTVNFGEFISIPNAAYIDTNNFPFADQLLEQGIAEQTGLTKSSGFCTYPLWVFKEEFLQKIGGENYQAYIQAYKEYDPYRCFYDDEEPDMAEDSLAEGQDGEEEQSGAACPEMGGM